MKHIVAPIVVLIVAVAAGLAVTRAAGSPPSTQAGPSEAPAVGLAQRAGAEAQATYDGAELFKTWCASCHGVSADGGGPLAPQMRRRVPDLTQIAEKNGGMFPVARVRRIIDGREVGAHGNPDMPVWGTAFKTSKDGYSEASVRARIDAIVRYLETIQKRNAQ